MLCRHLFFGEAKQQISVVFVLHLAKFDFAGFSADQPADGFSFSLLPTSNYGTSGMGPNLSESANAPGTFGLGFRTYSGATNAVATHWDNQELFRNNVDMGQVSFRNGVWNQAQLDITPLGPGSNVKLQLTGDVHGTPTTVTVYDLDNATVVARATLTMDIRNAIHGLEVWPYDD